MSDLAECVERLRDLIQRSERGELAEVQALIIQQALAAPDFASRAEAMAELQSGLAAEIGSGKLEPIQMAYYSVVDAMIDRTRDAVRAPPGDQ